MSLNEKTGVKEAHLLDEKLTETGPNSVATVNNKKSSNETSKNVEDSSLNNTEEGDKDSLEKKRRGRPPKNPTPAKTNDTVEETNKGIFEYELVRKF